MKVMAIRPGIADNHLKEPGSVFEVDEKLFSPEWMIKMEVDMLAISEMPLIPEIVLEMFPLPKEEPIKEVIQKPIPSTETPKKKGLLKRIFGRS